MEVGLGPDHIVLDWEFGTQLPPKRAQLLRSSAHVCCGQTAAWIKMPLGTKIGLVPGRIVLHGDPAPPPKRGTASNFGPMSLWPNGRPSQLLLSTRYNYKSNRLAYRPLLQFSFMIYGNAAENDQRINCIHVANSFSVRVEGYITSYFSGTCHGVH